MWRLSFLFIFGSVALMGWLAFDIGSFAEVASANPLPSPVPSPMTMGPPPGDAKSVSGLQSLEGSLAEREKSLSDREAELKKRSLEVADKEAVLSGRSVRYESIIANLRKQVAELEALNDAKIAAYRKLYEQMDPKKVASILEDTDPFLVGQILGEMRTQTSAEIMSKMSNEKVRLITEKYLLKRYLASSHKPPISNGANEGQSNQK